MNGDAPEDRPLPAADRALLVVLLILNGLVMAAVPVAALRAFLVLRAAPAGRFPGWFPPALFAALLVFELLLLWRFRSLRRRLARGRRPPRP